MARCNMLTTVGYAECKWNNHENEIFFRRGSSFALFVCAFCYKEMLCVCVCVLLQIFIFSLCVHVRVSVYAYAQTCTRTVNYVLHCNWLFVNTNTKHNTNEYMQEKCKILYKVNFITSPSQQNIAKFNKYYTNSRKCTIKHQMITIHDNNHDRKNIYIWEWRRMQ